MQYILMGNNGGVSELIAASTPVDIFTIDWDDARQLPLIALQNTVAWLETVSLDACWGDEEKKAISDALRQLTAIVIERL